MTPNDLPIRITVLESWDEIPLTVSPATLISDIKRTALARSRARGTPGEYMIKYNGAEVYEPGTTMADAGVVPNSALIVLRRRRTPVR